MCGASRTRGAAGRQSQWPVGWPLGCGGGVPADGPAPRSSPSVGWSGALDGPTWTVCGCVAAALSALTQGRGARNRSPPPARAAVRWRDGVTVPWQPLRQRAATKDTTRREVSARGGDVNPHFGRGSLLVWCVPWWAGHLAMCKVGPAGRWSTPPRRPRVLRGAVVEVAQGRCYVPRA